MQKYGRIIIRYRLEDIMALNKIKKMLVDEDDTRDDDDFDNESEKSITPSTGKMILLEPRAFSESSQIADHLKKRNTVVVNMKRVTPDQAKRIVDFLSGTVYAIGGCNYLCTPKNLDVEGRISEEDKNNKDKDSDNILDW